MLKTEIRSRFGVIICGTMEVHDYSFCWWSSFALTVEVVCEVTSRIPVSTHYLSRALEIAPNIPESCRSQILGYRYRVLKGAHPTQHTFACHICWPVEMNTGRRCISWLDRRAQPKQAQRRTAIDIHGTSMKN